MKREFDFSKAKRGKFYRADIELNIPVYLDRDVAEAVRQRASRTNTSLGVIVNRWLREEILAGVQTRRPKSRHRRAR